jgi:hypothetical protein
METRIKSLPSNIHYSGNKEYRQQIRNIFDISVTARSFYVDPNVNSREEQEEDEETTDELNYDTSLVDKGMEELFTKTMHKNEFKDLYLSAAGRMFSTDLRIGQAVICAYDTFHLYYTCIWHLYNNGENEIAHLDEYKQLQKWFS